MTAQPTVSVAADRRSTVVLLHSLGTDSRLWRHQVAHLEHNHHVVAPDSNGHGRTPLTGTVTVGGWVDDLHRLVSTCGPVHLVGLSMGGIQALAYAATHPGNVSSVIAANTFARLPREAAADRVQSASTAIEATGMAAYATRYLEETLTRRVDDADYTNLVSAIGSMSAAAYLASAKATFFADVTADLAAITSPTLVVIGDSDLKVPMERTQTILDNVAGSTLASIPAAGHLSCVENPSSFNDVVTEFIARVDDTSREPVGR
ncbi:alpha/beta fold hydrolase [Gordonia humi]|uniref:3-oxoadipate enol-lactonase n=1 Tax=Gordonia humi TaxID=686429 RepID=A0A840F631_9ACTN|nr:alpha/beta fold hydrolase [Gordonia humi]MBB4138124.1 3-oxoadipate enol-lactonase [Gordonia humi]